MKDNINQKIARIPFGILYFVSAFIICFDLVFTYSFLKNNPRAMEGNPIHAYFSENFGLTYFLILIPIVLVLLLGSGKLAEFIIKKYDSNSQVKGDNYLMVLVALIAFPNVLCNELAVLLFQISPLLSFREALIAGVFLGGGYVFITEAAEKKAKK